MMKMYHIRDWAHSAELRPCHPDPDPIVNCARFGNMEPPGFARVWALFLVLCCTSVARFYLSGFFLAQ